MTVSLDQVVQALPAHLKSAATPALVNRINTIASDPETLNVIRDNFMSYTSVMKEGKFKTDDYLNAVAYVSHKLLKRTNEEAWALTFPQRYAALMAQGASKKDISAHVSAYNKGKLVNLIMEQSIVPTWVLNADLHQEAINHAAFLMKNANSEKVQVEAAGLLMTHLKRPEALKADLSIEVKDSSGMAELKDMLSQVAQQQQQAIADKAVNVKDILAMPIIQGESTVKNG